jgi:hypothetical protein
MLALGAGLLALAFSGAVRAQGGGVDVDVASKIILSSSCSIRTCSGRPAARSRSA